MITKDLALGEYNQAKARQSLGSSNDAIYRCVAKVLEQRQINGNNVLDVGCGTGALNKYIGQRFCKYVGVDLVRYDGFPENSEFVLADLESQTIPLPSSCADAVIAVETIEHLENPRGFFRELTRLAKPTGYVIVTTPNQLSWLSLVTLIVNTRFSAFQDCHYPAHLTALLEIDLRRMAQEVGLSEVACEFSNSGRIVLTAKHYPKWLSSICPRAFSDNVLLIGRKS
jgi:2-polyprenyl-3-methyl-5-hydroxy-6-metoxy-1,4-benzoquinol methylase